MSRRDRRHKPDHVGLWTARVLVDSRARIERICYVPQWKADPVNNRKLLLLALGLVVVGVVAVWLVKALLYVIVGGLLIGGALYLYTKARNNLDGR
jgi:hypothetical protein